MLVFIIYINILSFLLMGYDKIHAIKKKNRIPEKLLITISFIGGGIGILLGMTIFHHKTKKIKFNILVPLSIILNIIFFYTIKK